MRGYQEVTLPEAETLIKIDHLPKYDYENYDLTNSKELMRYFFQIEKICRGSRSYKKFISFLKDHCDMDKCSFFQNVNGLDTSEIQIHMHHEPFTLFDIVNIVYNKRYSNNEDLSENQVAKEVMFIHYKLMIGLIPLSETIHELVHNGFLFIPTTKVFGYYKTFFQEYEQFIDSGLKRTLTENEKVSELYDFEKETKVLEINPIYIDTTGAYELPKTEDIMKIFKEKIELLDGMA